MKEGHKRFAKACFELTCICIASFIIYDQFEKYLKNEDSSTFSIKSFAEEADNKYPEISVCFSAVNTADLNNINKFTLDDIKWNKESFLQLTGLPIDIMNTSSRHDASAKPDSSSNSWVMDIFKGSWVISTNSLSNEDRTFDGSKIFKHHQHNVTNKIIWTDLFTVCVTRKPAYSSYDVLERQMMLLKARDMQIFDYFWIFVHPPNQLMRKIRKAAHGRMISTATYRGKINKIYDESKNLVEIFITNVKVVEKRSKPDEPCNKNNQEDDENWMKHAILKLKCIPMYWNGSFIRDEDTLSLPFCSDLQQYTKAQQYASDAKILFSEFHPPCRNLVSTSHFVVGNASSKGITNNILRPMLAKELIFLRIRYKIREFEEIRNSRAFTGWDLFGQVGGIIGLMLGFSFLQVPTLISGINLYFQPKNVGK